MALTAKKVYAILKRQISNMEAKLNSPVRYRGTVATADLLPLNPDIGDMYNIESKSVYGEAGMNVAWNGVVWDTMGAPIDMSLYLTKEEADAVIQRLVTEYFEKNPVKPGATTEQAQQIEQNKTDIASLKTETGSLKEDLGNLNDKKITKFYASNLGETHLSDPDNGKIMDMMIYGKSEQFATTGKNLLKIIDGTQTTRGVTVTAKDGVFALKGTATESGWAIFDVDSFVLDGTCVLSSNTPTDVKTVAVNKSYETVLFQNSSDTLENAEVSKVCFTVGNGKTYDISNILVQIEKGSEATSYEPYTGGQPSPSPDYPQEIKSVVNPTVKVVGKNLLNPTLQTITENGVTCTANGDGTYTLNGTAISDTNFYIIGAYNNDIKITLNPEKEYICKGTQDAKIEMYIGNANNAVPSEDGKSIQIKNTSSIAFVIFRVRSGSIINNVTVYPQLEEGSVSTAFEPYHEQTVTLPYTLNAIPVSSGGNITIDGQQYIADYVDVERGKLARMVDTSKLDSTQSIVDKTEWLLAEPQEVPLTDEEIRVFKALATYYPVTNISISSEQLDGYAVFNYPISLANGWNYVKQQLNDNRDYIYDMDVQSAEAYVNSEYAVALTELEV